MFRIILKYTYIHLYVCIYIYAYVYIYYIITVFRKISVKTYTKLLIVCGQSILALLYIFYIFQSFHLYNIQRKSGCGEERRLCLSQSLAWAALTTQPKQKKMALLST
jgi:hypothetical protein